MPILDCTCHGVCPWIGISVNSDPSPPICFVSMLNGKTLVFVSMAGTHKSKKSPICMGARAGRQFQTTKTDLPAFFVLLVYKEPHTKFCA